MVGESNIQDTAAQRMKCYRNQKIWPSNINTKHEHYRANRQKMHKHRKREKNRRNQTNLYFSLVNFIMLFLCFILFHSWYVTRLPISHKYTTHSNIRCAHFFSLLSRKFSSSIFFCSLACSLTLLPFCFSIAVRNCEKEKKKPSTSSCRTAVQ